MSPSIWLPIGPESKDLLIHGVQSHLIKKSSGKISSSKPHLIAHHSQLMFQISLIRGFIICIFRPNWSSLAHTIRAIDKLQWALFSNSRKLHLSNWRILIGIKHIFVIFDCIHFILLFHISRTLHISSLVCVPGNVIFYRNQAHFLYPFGLNGK